MRRFMVCVCVGLMCILVIGCAKDEKPAADEAVKPATESVDKAAPAVEKAAEEVSKAAEEATKEAQLLLDKIMAALKENDLDAAEESLKELEGQKDTLSDPMKKKVESARTSFDMAKKAEELKSKAPELPKL